jgi:hypothetical protein
MSRIRVVTSVGAADTGAMPELLTEGLPERFTRTKFDFTQWSDGRAWKFVKGEDYDSSTETFRYNVRRWAKAQGLEVECRPYPAVDRDGNEVPITKADPVALGVRFHRGA